MAIKVKGRELFEDGKRVGCVLGYRAHSHRFGPEGHYYVRIGNAEPVGPFAYFKDAVRWATAKRI